MPAKKLNTAEILLAVTDTIPHLFDQAQTSTANHRKNCVALHKIHLQAASVTELSRSKNGESLKLIGERAFSDVFVDMTNRVLVVKKGPAAAERAVKFVGAYVKFICGKAAESKEEGRACSAAPEGDEQETPTSRFITRLLAYLLRGFTAKDKTVRLRCVSLVAELVSHLGELDEDVYSVLRASLMDRARDKESAIRAHAIVALSKLISGEDPDDLEEGEASILDTVLDSLCYDPAPEVRRIALLNTPLLPETLPSLLTRTRDVDVGVRALLYAHTLLPSDSTTSASTSRASRNALSSPNRLNSPRQLTIEQRERVVKDGLGDREGKVRAGAGKMLAGWYGWAAESLGESAEDQTIPSLTTFLKLFDVVSEGGDLVAVDALKSVFVTRPDVLDAIAFEDTYWRSLTPESALLARAFIEQSESIQNQEACLEAARIPVVTAFAFYVQEACNNIFDSMEALEELRVSEDDPAQEEVDRLEAELADRIFVLGEVLKIAAKLDYTDEIGRRKVFHVVRDMLAHELLPETLMDACLDVLKQTTPSEREIIRIVVEIINELRDSAAGTDNEDTGNGSRRPDESMATSNSHDTLNSQGSKVFRRQKSMHEMTTEERAQADAADSRCLALCIVTLKRVNGSFDENSTLEGVLADLIIPAVKRRDMILRERGLVSLGLCCLIATNMAMSSFQLFLNQVQSAPEDLKLKVLQIIFDILMVYEGELLRRNNDVADRIITFLLQTLEVEESNAVQALLCIGISKLMINGLITDERVLTSLVLAYVSPVTSDNQELRQCLAYFLPVYCYSLPANQDRMRAAFLTVFDLVSKVYEELDEGQEMITPLQFGNLFVDWTNPMKMAPSESSGSVASDVHVDLAVDILKALYDKERSDADIKVFCQLLAKLYIPDKPQSLGLLCLGTLLEHLKEDVEDPATAKLLTKFKSRFQKQHGREFDRVKGEAGRYADSEGYREICELVGIEVPEARQEENEESSDHENESAEEHMQGEEEEVEEEEVEEPPRKKGQDRRRSAVRKHKEVEEDEGEEEDEEDVEEDVEEDEHESVHSRSIPASRSPTPPPQKMKKRRGLPPPPDSPDPDESPAPPSTPHRKRQASKRVRSPLKSPSMASPAHKRVNSARSPKKSHLRKEVPDPFIDESPRRPVKINGSSSRPHLKQQLRQEEEEEKEESSEPPSESGSEEEVPVQLGRRPAAVQQSRSKPVVRRPNGKPVVTRRSAAPTPDFDSGSD